MRASLVLVLLQWLHSEQVHSLQSKQRRLTIENDVVHRVDLNLCNTSVHANLGGVGGVNVGDTGPEDKTDDGEWKKEIRYKKVATLPTGETLDLVVTNMTEYAANPVNPKPDDGAGGKLLNGRKGCLGRLNIKAPGEVKLNFALVMQGSDIPAPTDYRYDFTILDFDRSKHGMHEEVTAQGFEAYSAPTIEPVRVGELFSFASPSTAVEVPNPEDPDRLTGSQINASVGFVYTNVNHWVITAKAIDSVSGLGGGRNFFFAGRTVLQANGSLHKVIHNTDEEQQTKAEQMNPQKAAEMAAEKLKTEEKEAFDEWKAAEERRAFEEWRAAEKKKAREAAAEKENEAVKENQKAAEEEEVAAEEETGREMKAAEKENEAVKENHQKAPEEKKVAAEEVTGREMKAAEEENEAVKENQKAADEKKVAAEEEMGREMKAAEKENEGAEESKAAGERANTAAEEKEMHEVEETKAERMTADEIAAEKLMAEEIEAFEEWKAAQPKRRKRRGLKKLKSILEAESAARS